MNCNIDNEKVLIPELKIKKYKSLKYKKNYGKQMILPFQCEMLNLGELALKFPPKATEDKEKQVQKMNYEHIIRTMSELIKKYGLDVEN